jgi:hypothetical protein
MPVGPRAVALAVSLELQALLKPLKPLLELAAEEKDGDSWRFPFTRGLRDDLRYGDRYAGLWQLQRVMLEQRWRGGAQELIKLLEAATLVASGGAHAGAEVPSEGSER